MRRWNNKIYYDNMVEEKIKKYSNNNNNRHKEEEEFCLFVCVFEKGVNIY